MLADGLTFCDNFPTENDWPVNTGAPDEAMALLTIPRHGSRPANIPKTLNPKAKLPGAINISFYDGHVAQVPLEQLWQQEWHRGWQTPAIRPGLPGGAQSPY